MDAHARSIVRSCFYQLRQLRSVQRSLTFEARRALVTAFIANRVDYCNAVFYGVAKAAIRPNDPIHLNKTVLLSRITAAITPNDPIQLNCLVESHRLV
jgi:hypothetical protein